MTLAPTLSLENPDEIAKRSIDKKLVGHLNYSEDTSKYSDSGMEVLRTSAPITSKGATATNKHLPDVCVTINAC